jgi:hypothetical protein
MNSKKRISKNTKRATGTQIQRHEEPDFRHSATALALGAATKHVAMYRQWLSKQQNACDEAEDMLQLVIGPTVEGKPLPPLLETLGTALRALDGFYLRRGRGEKLPGDKDLETDLTKMIHAAVDHIGSVFLESITLEVFRAATVTGPVAAANVRAISDRIDAVASRVQGRAEAIDQV